MRYLSLLLLIVFLTTVSASAQISGTPTMCQGENTSLSATPIAGGVWSSANSAIAVVDASGNVTGVSAGATTISYGTVPTFVTLNVTVNALPAAITGSSTVCVGSNVTLSSTTPGGIWTSGDVPIAVVGSASGIATGMIAGNTTISYTVPTGCRALKNLTVNATPSAISGASMVCVGSNILLSESSMGGTWVSSNPAIATVGPTGTVSGIGAGVANISYQYGSGCSAIRTITVNIQPAAITGATQVCAGLTTTVSSASPGGVWGTTSSTFTIGAGTGVVTGVTAGTGIITYSISGTGCYTTRVMTVTALPDAIGGTATVCPTATTTFTNTVGGGIWISDATSVATVSGSGGTASVMGISGGTATISYVTGPSCMSTRIVTVNPAPYAGTISGPSLVCIGSSMTLTSTVSGGYWTSSAPAFGTVGLTTGVVTGITVGTTYISYAATNICGVAYATVPVNVSPTPTVITGTTVLCAGTTTTLANGVPGGSWISGTMATATVGASTGIVSGVAAGTSTITYSLGGGCFVTTNVTVNLAPTAITGADNLCVGGTSALTEAVLGGIWTSSAPAVAIVSTIGASTGVVSGLSAGTANIIYSIASCSATFPVTVNALPALSATATPDACGGGYELVATGGVSYSWAPSTGLSCTACATTNVTPAATTTYTLIGTTAAGCNDNTTVTVNGNRIYGHITFSAAAPTVSDVKVWLVQYNPSDSSITATDSMVSCLDGTQPFYEFTGKPAGSYMVKAKLLSSTPGTSDYIPTYGSSTANWYDAATIAHTSNADGQDINMIFGTVPAGPGFISGYVYSGAGKGTAGLVAEPGMLIYLKDATTGQVLTYTYTNASGGYTFGSIGFGNYIIAPQEYDYYTTPSATVAVSVSSVSSNNITFKKNTLSHTIYPYVATGVSILPVVENSISIFPNPANDYIAIKWLEQQQGTADVNITDMTGRSLISKMVNINSSTPSHVNIAALSTGVYFINVQSIGINYSGKLVVSK